MAGEKQYISRITLLDNSSYDIKDAEAQSALGGHTVGSNVPSNAEFTDTQSDWNENSDASKAYIANKPFSVTKTTTETDTIYDITFL